MLSRTRTFRKSSSMSPKWIKTSTSSLTVWAIKSSNWWKVKAKRVLWISESFSSNNKPVQKCFSRNPLSLARFPPSILTNKPNKRSLTSNLTSYLPAGKTNSSKGTENSSKRSLPSVKKRCKNSRLSSSTIWGISRESSPSKKDNKRTPAQLQEMTSKNSDPKPISMTQS